MRDRISWIALVIWQRALPAEGSAEKRVKKIGKIGRKDAGEWLRYLLPVAVFAAGVLFIWSRGFFQDAGSRCRLFKIIISRFVKGDFKKCFLSKA